MNKFDVKKLLEATRKEVAKNILELFNKYDYDIAVAAVRKAYLGESKEVIKDVK